MVDDRRNDVGSAQSNCGRRMVAAGCEGDALTERDTSFDRSIGGFAGANILVIMQPGLRPRRAMIICCIAAR
jgi:hypothetical protein